MTKATKPARPTVLVADDSDDNREMLSEFLTFMKCRVLEARDGAEAIDIARRELPRVILMDLSMPVLDGWDSTRLLKSDPLTKNIVIIAFTAHAFPAEQSRAVAAGCDAVITKPFDLISIADAVRAAMAQGPAAFVKSRPVVQTESPITQDIRRSK